MLQRMARETITLREVSQEEKGKYHTVSPVCGPKTRHTGTYLQNRTESPDTENRLVVAKWESGIGRCQLLYVREINSKGHGTAQGAAFNIL